MFADVCLSTRRGVPGSMGLPGPGRAWSGECRVWGVPGPGGCLVETPLTATTAGGTHPTGMHSCLDHAHYRDAPLNRVAPGKY